MNKIIASSIIAMAVLMSGCEKGSNVSKFQDALPEGMKDCKVYNLYDGDGGRITIARCPNSTTSVESSGKGGMASIVTEAPEPAKKEVIVEKPKEIAVPVIIAPDKVVIDGVEYTRSK